jgi:hypothetical protein
LQPETSKPTTTTVQALVSIDGDVVAERSGVRDGEMGLAHQFPDGGIQCRSDAENPAVSGDFARRSVASKSQSFANCGAVLGQKLCVVSH